MTIAAGTVVQNIIYEGLPLMVIIIDNDQKVASSKKLNQFKIREQNHYPIYNQNGQIDTPCKTKMAEKLYPLGLSIPT